MARGQAHPRGGQQVDERVRRGRHGGVHRVEHLLVLVRARHGEHAGMRPGDVVGLGPEAAGHDHAPVLGSASPMASRLSALAESRNPQVFTITASAPV